MFYRRSDPNQNLIPSERDILLKASVKQIKLRHAANNVRGLTTSMMISWIWNRRMMVQISPRINRGLPSTISSAPMFSNVTYIIAINLLHIQKSSKKRIQYVSCQSVANSKFQILRL